MDTIFINISLAIISTIARFSRPLSVSIVTIKTMDAVFIHISLAIAIARSSRPLAISISMMAMDTLHTTVDITGSMAIAWLSRPLAIAIVAMKSLDSVVITSRMAIAITRFSLSRPLA